MRPKLFEQHLLDHPSVCSSTLYFHNSFEMKKKKFNCCAHNHDSSVIK